MVVRDIVAGRVFPEPTATDPGDALIEPVHTLRDFAMANLGIGQYLTRLAALGRGFMIRLAEGQQAAFASRFGYPPTRIGLLASTVTEHVIALGKTSPPSHDDTAPGPLPEQTPMVRTGAELTVLLSLQERFEQPIRTIAWSSISLLDRENPVT